MLQRRKREFSKNKNYSRRPSVFSRFIFYSVSFLFFGGVIYSLFFSPFLSLSLIVVKNNKYIESRTISEEINGKISGKYFGLVQKNNFFLVSEKKLEEGLAGSFKRIRKIEAQKKFPSTLEISVVERIPTAIVCSGDRCLVLDEEGEAYDAMEPSSDEAKKLGLFGIIDESKKMINLGEKIIGQDYMRHASEIKNKLRERADIETADSFRTPALISNDLRIKTNEGWDIYFSAVSDVEKGIAILKMILKEKISESQQRDLEYIDLRVDNKVYYKLKSDSQSEIDRKKAQEAATTPPVVEEKKKKKKD